MENMEHEMKPQEKKEDASEKREMMELPDGTIADVTEMSPEERRELIESYKAN